MGRPSPHPSTLRSAFTLIELVTVIAIIGILVALVVPGVASMWSQRNEAGTINLVKGLLQSARSQAIRNGERGLFFYVDPIDNVQRVVFIEAEPPNKPDAAGRDDDARDCGNTPGCVTEIMTVNRFRVVRDKIYTVPPPYRVAPSWAMDAARAEWPDGANDISARRLLGNSEFYERSGNFTPRYHRNYFTVIFSAKGELEVGRSVLIHDPDRDNDSSARGDTLGLRVAPEVTQFWVDSRDNSVSYMNINPINASASIYDMICLDDRIRAANFISVDGLVVYDESSAEGLGGNTDESAEIAGAILGAEIRSNGRPFYIARYTGDIIMGVKGLQ